MSCLSLRTTPCTCSTYDVFISFCGEDTRTRFTDHLCKAFKDKRIRVYRDEIDLERGKAIWTELVQAIKTSRIAVIVFSKNYANSKWCLDELAVIMDRKRSTSRRRCKGKQTFTVLPIFYDVSPSEVLEQKGNFAKALPNGPKKMVKKWRDALTESANLSGFPLKPDRSESRYIEQIVECISKTLHRESLSAAPAGSESNIHREDSSAVTHNMVVVDASSHQKTTIANKCARSTCGINVSRILGLRISTGVASKGGLYASKCEDTTSSS